MASSSSQQAELGPFGDAMRQVVDADAELAHLLGRFQHGAGDAPLVQHQRQGQPAHAAARDQHLHPRPPPNARQGSGGYQPPSSGAESGTPGTRMPAGRPCAVAPCQAAV